MAADLSDCKHDVMHQFYLGQSQYGTIGTKAGGDISGIIGGAMDAMTADMKPDQIDAAVDQCMQRKGYEKNR